MLLEVKISDQYLNILSILRGKSVNSQYQYLEGRESIFLKSLSPDAPAAIVSALNERWNTGETYKSPAPLSEAGVMLRMGV